MNHTKTCREVSQVRIEGLEFFEPLRQRALFACFSLRSNTKLVWYGIELPVAVQIRQAELGEANDDAVRQLYRGDPHLPIVSLRIEQKEAT